MKRLTNRVFGDEAYIYDEYVKERPFTCENKNCYVGEAVEALAAYEDTGLTPEEVEALKAENKRLTERNECFEEGLNPDIALQFSDSVGKIIEKLEVLNQQKEEPTTAEKLLWLVENKFLAFVEYNEKNGFVGIGLNAWNEKQFYCPIVPTYKRYGKTTDEAINTAYSWAKEQEK